MSAGVTSMMANKESEDLKKKQEQAAMNMGGAHM